MSFCMMNERKRLNVACGTNYLECPSVSIVSPPCIDIYLDYAVKYVNAATQQSCGRLQQSLTVRLVAYL